MTPVAGVFMEGVNLVGDRATPASIRTAVAT